MCTCPLALTPALHFLPTHGFGLPLSTETMEARDRAALTPAPRMQAQGRSASGVKARVASERLFSNLRSHGDQISQPTSWIPNLFRLPPFAQPHSQTRRAHNPVGSSKENSPCKHPTSPPRPPPQGARVPGAMPGSGPVESGGRMPRFQDAEQEKAMRYLCH